MNILTSTIIGTALAMSAVFPAQPSDLQVTVLQNETVVYDYLASRCHASDHPDMPPRAWQNNQMTTILAANNFDYRTNSGSSLDGLTHNCAVGYTSQRDEDPARHSYLDWVISPYYLPAVDTVVALVHSEYRGYRVNPRNCNSTDYNCWYNTMNHITSTDGGFTFTQPGSNPATIAMSLPEQFSPDQTTWAGHRNPSNILLGKDGAYYIFTLVSGGGAANSGQQPGNCLFRTTDLLDPTAWRGWDGAGFNVTMVDPYKVTPANHSAHYCKPIGPTSTGSSIGTVAYHTPSGLYLMIWGEQVWETMPDGKRAPRGYIFSSTSEDLITWRPRRVVQQTSLWGTECPADPSNWTTYGYPGLLAVVPGQTKNYEWIDHSIAYLYKTAFRRTSCTTTVARDLVRSTMQITIVP